MEASSSASILDVHCRGIGGSEVQQTVDRDLPSELEASLGAGACPGAAGPNKGTQCVMFD